MELVTPAAHSGYGYAGGQSIGVGASLTHRFARSLGVEATYVQLCTL